jgi:solute carrier family 25 phosphate transporter 23/24/25/41
MLTSSPPRELADARRTTFDGSYTGAQDRPWIPRLRGDPLPLHPLARSLLEFREQEGAVARERHFRELWKRLPTSASVPLDHERHAPDPAPVAPGLSPQDAAELERKYADELHGCCHGALAPFHARIRWKEFRAYAEAKEAGASTSHPGMRDVVDVMAELWHIFHDELDLDGNGHIDAHEFETALKRAGALSPSLPLILC